MPSAIAVNSCVFSLPFSMTEMLDSLRSHSRVRYSFLANGTWAKIQCSRRV